MTVTYDEVIQGFYTRYQNGYSCFNQFKNCFVDIKEYQDLISDIYLRFQGSRRKRLEFISGQITLGSLQAQFRIAITRGAIDALRKRKRRGFESLDSFEAYESSGKYRSGEVNRESSELFQFAHKIFRKAGLTIQEAAIFLDIHYIGSSQDEVAKMHGITDRTVRNKLKSATEKLRRLI